MPVGDEELSASLRAIRRSLANGGNFTFETRNPATRIWERWTPEHPIEVVDSAGRAVRVTYEVESVTGDLVSLSETTSDWDGTPAPCSGGPIWAIQPP
jgi:hypothetical protein